MKRARFHGRRVFSIDLALEIHAVHHRAQLRAACPVEGLQRFADVLTASLPQLAAKIILSQSRAIAATSENMPFGGASTSTASKRIALFGSVSTRSEERSFNVRAWESPTISKDDSSLCRRIAVSLAFGARVKARVIVAFFRREQTSLQGNEEIVTAYLLLTSFCHNYSRHFWENQAV